MTTRLSGSGIEPALPPPPLLRRAGLVVDEDGEPFDLAQRLLHLFELRAVMDGRALGPDRASFGYLCGSSVTMAMRFAPSAAACRATWSTVMWPSTGCPPVIATASL